VNDKVKIIEKKIILVKIKGKVNDKVKVIGEV